MKAWMRPTGEDPLQLVRIRGDSFGYADLSDGFLRLIVIDGEYDKDFFRVADALLREGGEFLDVEANHGLLSFGLAKNCRTAYGFICSNRIRSCWSLLERAWCCTRQWRPK
jgi:hypothetical protein